MIDTASAPKVFVSDNVRCEGLQCLPPFRRDDGIVSTQEPNSETRSSALAGSV